MGAPGGTPGGPGEAPPISSDALYSNANRDRLGGKFDLAVQEYADYIIDQWYNGVSDWPNNNYWANADTATKQPIQFFASGAPMPSQLVNDSATEASVGPQMRIMSSVSGIPTIRTSRILSRRVSSE